MKFLHQTSAPSTPKVSPPEKKSLTGVCIYCGCTEDRPCAVPSGQRDYVACWWQNDSRTVCSAPLCTVRWMQDEEQRLKRETMRRLALHCGLYTRVAKQLGVSSSHVRRVAMGERLSTRISSALLQEIKRIDMDSAERSA
jgi:hypothetical protein